MSDLKRKIQQKSDELLKNLKTELKKVKQSTMTQMEPAIKNCVNDFIKAIQEVCDSTIESIFEKQEEKSENKTTEKEKTNE